jgi:bacterial/archaeal transporter family protein
MWFLFALLSGFFAALLAIVVRLHLQHINPLLSTLLFYIISTIFLLTISLFSKKIQLSLISTFTARDWLSIIVAALLNCTAFIFYLLALQCGKTCSVVAVDRLSILFVVILSIVFLQETFTIKSILGSIMMIAGAAFLSA